MPNEVTITNLSDDGTYDMPFTLQVSYTADEDGLEVAIVYSGYAVPPQAAPQSGSSLEFQLDWAGTVSGTSVTANLQEDTSPNTVLASDAKTGLTFNGGGP